MRVWAMRVALAVVITASIPVQAAKGPTGLYITGDRSGFVFNPVMTRVYVQKVDDGSCAERSGFVAGDEIVTIEGSVVAGRKARELMSYWKSLKREDGVRFVVKRNEEPRNLVLCGASTR